MDTTLQQKQMRVMLWTSIILPLGGILIFIGAAYGAICYVARTLFDILLLVGIQNIGTFQEVRSLLNTPASSVVLPLCTTLFAYICAKKCFGVTTKSTLQTLPIRFVETTLWIGLLGVLTFLPLGFLSAVLSHILLSITVIALDLRSKEKTRVVPQRPVSFPPPISVQQVRPVCLVCQQPSIYEVCLKCERTHQKEIQRVRSQNWRAKKANEPATLTIAEWLQTLEYFHYRCAYCQTKPYECLEHYHPLGSGHKDGGTTAKNCVPACYKCNTGKSNKEPEE